MKKTEREVLKEKLLKLQGEWMRIRQASADASDRIIGLDFVKNRRKAGRLADVGLR